MLTTIYDIINCTNYDSTLSTIATLTSDQATISQLKEDLEAKKKLNNKLKYNVTKLEADKAWRFKWNGELEADMKAMEFDFSKEIHQLKEYSKLESTIEKWCP